MAHPELDVDLRVDIAAPTGEVWRALLRPERWWDGVSLQPRAAGAFVERWADDAGVPRVTRGRVRALIPERRLQLTWADDGWEYTTVVAFEVTGDRRTAHLGPAHASRMGAVRRRRAVVARGTRVGLAASPRGASPVLRDAGGRVGSAWSPPEAGEAQHGSHRVVRAMIVDVGQIVALLIAAVGLFLTASQVWMQRREQRSGQIVRLHQRLYDDAEIQAMYRRLERGLGYPVHPTGSVERAEHDRLEEQLDKLLGLLQVAARLYQMRLVAAEDLDLIAYEYLTVHQNPDVQAYLNAVEASNRARQMSIDPVSAFREVGDLLQRKHHHQPVPPEWRGGTN